MEFKLIEFCKNRSVIPGYYLNQENFPNKEDIKSNKVWLSYMLDWGAAFYLSTIMTTGYLNFLQSIVIKNFPFKYQLHFIASSSELILVLCPLLYFSTTLISVLLWNQTLGQKLCKLKLSSSSPINYQQALLWSFGSMVNLVTLGQTQVKKRGNHFLIEELTGVKYCKEGSLYQTLLTTHTPTNLLNLCTETTITLPQEYDRKAA